MPAGAGKMTGRVRDLALIVGLSYDLCASLYEHVNRFPRAQRTLLGRVILDEALRMLAALSRANRLADKMEALEEASGRLDALRIALRLAKRLGFLSDPGYAALTETADEVGRMLGGWLKHERGRDPPEAADADRTEARREPAAEPPSAGPAPARAGRPASKGAVRYKMESPPIERYLAAKLAHPTAIVLIEAGAFCQAFFEDAHLLGRALGLSVRELSADSEPEKIFACGLPQGEARELYRAARPSRPGRARGVGGGPHRRPDSWRQLQQRHERGPVRGQRQQPAV